eukprot:tig00000478_g1264.t1
MRRNDSFVLYYQEPGVRPEPVLSDGDVIDEFPWELLSLKLREPYPWAPVHVDGPVPAEAIYDEAAVHVYHGLDLYMPGNFGHALGDFVFPVWVVTRDFGIETRDIQVLLENNCSLYESFNDTTCRTVQEMWPGVTDRRPALFHLYAPEEGLLCFRRLVAGTARRGFVFEGRRWPAFIDHFSAAIGVDPAAGPGPGPPRVAFARKRGRRELLDDEAVAAALAAQLGVAVDMVDPRGLSVLEQARLMRGYAVLVSPCGGISFLGSFLAPGAAAVFVDWFNVSSHRSERMEAYVWTWEHRIKSYYYPVLREELRINHARMMETRLDRENEQQIVRNFADVRLNLDRLLLFVYHALRHAQRSFAFEWDPPQLPPALRRPPEEPL